MTSVLTDFFVFSRFTNETHNYHDNENVPDVGCQSVMTLFVGISHSHVLHQYIKMRTFFFKFLCIVNIILCLQLSFYGL